MEEKGIIKEPKEYVSISTRLPFKDAVHLKLICNRLNIPPSEYIRELIKKNIDSPTKKFLAGKNIMEYDKTNNSFSWLVELDSEREIEVLNNLSGEFLTNLKKAIDKALQDRNEWIDQSKSGSVDIPVELVGGRNG